MRGAQIAWPCSLLLPQPPPTLSSTLSSSPPHERRHLDACARRLLLLRFVESSSAAAAASATAALLRLLFTRGRRGAPRFLCVFVLAFSCSRCLYVCILFAGFLRRRRGERAISCFQRTLILIFLAAPGGKRQRGGGRERGRREQEFRAPEKTFGCTP